MAEELVKADNADTEEYSKPNPQINPRNISLNEIAGAVAEKHKDEFAETAPVIDDDNAPADSPAEVLDEPASVEEEAPAEVAEPAPAAEPVAAAPAREAIEPTKEYEVTIDGQKLKVPGQKIIDAGFRTYQKETAADYRLQVATDLLRRAEEQAATHKPDAAAPPQSVVADLSDTELANAIQYGSQEQAAAAIAVITRKQAAAPDPAQIAQFVAAQVRNETAFQEGLKFVQTEYADLLANPDIRDLFFVRENKARLPKAQGGLGDTRTPKELYQAIGEDLRKSLGRPKAAASTTQGSPTVATTAASRQERKAATPSVPRTAAGRLAEASTAPKVKTSSEIIAAMAAKRGQGNLTRSLKE